MFIDLKVGNLIDTSTGRRWDREFIWKEIRRRIAFFARVGMKEADRVFLHYGNCPEFFADLMAIWYLGGCAIPVDPRFTEYEVQILAQATRPQFSLWWQNPQELVSERLSELDVQLIDCSVLSMEDDSSAVIPSGSGEVQLDSDALILFTSGTTGNPKGVVHTHRSLLARWTALREALGIVKFRRTLCLLPTHFGHGLICNSLFPWLSGQDLFIVAPFQPAALAKLGTLLDEYEITFLSSVPSLWRFVLKTGEQPRARKLERVFCGSAPLSGSLWSEIQEWTGTKEVWNAYGITETGSWTAGTSLADFQPEDGLIGEPWGSVIRILKEADVRIPLAEMQECPVGESGYVWLNTPALMKGYFAREDLTTQVVTNGWFLTGDIGFKDDRGRLYLRGREREEINKGGMKVYPCDIDAVAERFESTVDVCAFACDDPLYGENIGIALVMKQTSDAVVHKLYRWMRQHLGRHQMPVRWYLLDTIPRNSHGKINRAQIARQCVEQNSLDVAKFLQKETTQE